VQFTGTYGETGVRYSLTVRAGDAEALSRQVSRLQLVRPARSSSGQSGVPRLHLLVTSPCLAPHKALSTTGGALSPLAPRLLSRTTTSGAGRLQVVKSDTATAGVPELAFEIPADTQRGSITTVEGLLRDAAEALRALQPERTAADPAQARRRRRRGRGPSAMRL
jgi:hypothetical protein